MTRNVNSESAVPAREMTLKVIIISFFLTAILAISNTYLALKVGLLTAASIPAAILSMGLMKFFRSSTIFEHNLVQTAASSGEAIAGGIGYTIPALVIIGFAHGFNYLDVAALGIGGGILGVLFSAIIRKTLLADPLLKFPEGQAISEVLKLKTQRAIGFADILIGSVLAAIIEFLQSAQAMFVNAFKLFKVGTSIAAVGLGLSPALIGAGFIVGARVGLSLLLGAATSYLIILPLISHGMVSDTSVGHHDALSTLFNQSLAMNMRYIGVGAMLCAGFITLTTLSKPLFLQLKNMIKHLKKQTFIPVHEQDLSAKTIGIGSLLMMILIGITLTSIFSDPSLHLSTPTTLLMTAVSLIYILVIGFISAMICGYFSGLVGVSASPGSSILIAALLLGAVLIRGTVSCLDLGHHGMLIGEVITILMVSVVMQIACISNDTLQDLKVGQLIGAKPRQQQIMLIFGVIVASLIVPLVMEVLYKAYGIAGAMPHPGMNPASQMAAPPAAIMAALTGALFHGAIPLKLLGLGALCVLIFMALQHLVFNLIFKRLSVQFSYIGIGIGMYLGLSTSMPLVIGALMSLFIRKRDTLSKQRKLLLACGMVAGSALMDVILAIPVALNPTGNGLAFHIHSTEFVILSVIGIGAMIYAYLKRTQTKA